MALVLILSVLLGCVTIALVARAVALPRVRATRQLGQIEVYGYGAEAPLIDEDEDEDERPRARLIAGLGAVADRRLGPKRHDELQRLLLSAGYYETDPLVFLGYQVLTSVGLALIVGWLAASAWSLILVVLVTAYAAGVGWMLLYVLLRARSRRRLEQIDRALPELVDLLVVAVEAGQGLNGAMRMAGARVSGALGEEMAILIREQDLGIGNTQILENLLRRVETPALRAFVRAVIQGERLGVSIGQVLRGQAQEARTRRRQAIEEKAQKVPIKILFPLAFLIFPALFIVVLYPGVHNFLHALGG